MRVFEFYRILCATIRDPFEVTFEKNLVIASWVVRSASHFSR